MKNSWLIWVLIIGAGIMIFVVFNYQGKQEATPLSEIFPEEETGVSSNANTSNVEYEFVDTQQPVSVSSKETKSLSQASVATRVTQSAVTKPAATSVNPAALKPVAVKTQASVTTPVVQSKYTIQISSFKEKAQAELSLSKIRKKEAEAYIYSRDVKDKGTWHRICIGKFENKSEAQSYLNKIKDDYKDSFILSLK